MSLRVLIADDEALARNRLRVLLGDIAQPAMQIVAEAASVMDVLNVLEQQPVDLLLLDIAMPGGDGMRLAELLHLQRANGQPSPAVIFVTAHAQHAVRAFDIEAVDYLTKPVRLERLQAALQKVERVQPVQQALQPDSPVEEYLHIPTRQGIELVPLSQVLYFKAELKYITVVTAQREYILDASLQELEQHYGERFLRIHRNALVARQAVDALLRPGSRDWIEASRQDPAIGEDTWGLRLRGLNAILAVSRRQLPQVRELLQQRHDVGSS